jgi:deoxyadenosine/deoxycytidine kinase/NTP pyrophosphatase (non-canonical NTP hydrolase)
VHAFINQSYRLEPTVSEPSNGRAWYIAIEGPIGVGKTTLARMLRERLQGKSLPGHLPIGLLLEVFEENPFLSQFYSDRARYAFQTQMFFLLSRYRQQQQGVPRLLRRGALISDYIFSKDWLFARLNLMGEEWEMYQRIHAALAEQIPTPDLVVYLQADAGVLMGRIVQRDRPYERNMDREYIESLCQAYDGFFASYQDAPVLFTDTNQLNIVTRPADFQSIVNRVRSALQDGTFQRPLPQFETPLAGDRWLARGRPLADFQRFHVELDRSKHFDTDPYFNYLCLSEEMGELGSEFAKLWMEEAALVAEGHEHARARRHALSRRRPALESELADCLAYLLKLANYAGIDLETAYVGKMHWNQERSWRESPKVGEEQG